VTRVAGLPWQWICGAGDTSCVGQPAGCVRVAAAGL